MPRAEGAASSASAALRLSDDGQRASQPRLLLWALSRAGKPIFTALGPDPDAYALLAGVLTALNAVVEQEGDALVSISAPGVLIVVRTLGELLFAAADVGPRPRPAPLLQRYLLFVHSQLQALLTSSLDRRLAARPGADVAPLLEGAERFLRSAALLPDEDRALSLALGPAVRIAHFPRAARAALVKALVRAPRPPSLLFAVVLLHGHVVTVLEPAHRPLAASDLLLLANVLAASAAFRLSGPDAAWWAPVCLPAVDARAWLHAYSALLAPPSLALVLLTASPADFYALAALAAAARAALASGLLHPSAALPSGAYTLDALGASPVRHFVCRLRARAQYSAPALASPYTAPGPAARLHSLYLRLCAERPRCGVVVVRSEAEVLVAWSAAAFDLLAAFAPTVAPKELLRAMHRLAEWCAEQHDELFAAPAHWPAP